MIVSQAGSDPASLAATATEAELIARACRGEATAFEAIMRRYNRLLFRAARGVMGDDADAQDVVQESYLRAFMRLGSFRAEAQLGTWLARIAINIALDTLRRRGREVRLDDAPHAGSRLAREHMMDIATPLVVAKSKYDFPEEGVLALRDLQIADLWRRSLSTPEVPPLDPDHSARMLSDADLKQQWNERLDALLVSKQAGTYKPMAEGDRFVATLQQKADEMLERMRQEQSAT